MQIALVKAFQFKVTLIQILTDVLVLCTLRILNENFCKYYEGNNVFSSHKTLHYFILSLLCLIPYITRINHRQHYLIIIRAKLLSTFNVFQQFFLFLTISDYQQKHNFDISCRWFIRC